MPKITNPRRNEDGSIDLDIDTVEYGIIPFTASPDDIEAHGKQLYNDAISGLYGTVKPYTPAIKTDIQKQREISSAVQMMLDDKARSLRYDNIMSIRSYCGWDNPFQIECETVAAWAAQCWVTAGQIEQDVINGLRTIPTAEQALAEMPKL